MSDDPAGEDRNFDDLAARFKRNVYDRLKGDIRLAVLRRDLAEFVPPLDRLTSERLAPPAGIVRVLDAGGGQGQLATEIARLGYPVDLCDISANMLDLAREHADSAGANNIEFIHDSIQRVCADKPGHYDVVLCHAVLEWAAEPRDLIRNLVAALKPGGFLSLTFYNVNSIVMKNLLRTNFRKVLENDYGGYKGSLTPTWPRETADVMDWLDDEGLEILCHSGIRCFHDYILDPDQRLEKPEEQLELELRFSRREPFRSLGRYVHLLLQKGE